jgi:hypothetical protein
LAAGEIVGHHSIEIQVAPDADARLDTLIKEFDARRYGSVSPFAKALFGRSFEKAERVAGVLAVWDDPMHPTIAMEHVAWAEQCLLASDNDMVRFATEYMHGGQVQADTAKVARTLDRVLKGEFEPRNANESRALENELAPWSMIMRATKLDKRRLDEAVENLRDLGDVAVVMMRIPHANGTVQTARMLRRAKP